jgi:23S rRNA (guanosine2251-2'-O)-methyltransferase
MLKEDLDAMLPEHAVHQGVIIDVAPLPEVSLKDIASKTKSNDVIVVLDQVTDPHNVGAILRSAAAFGAKAIVVQSRHAPDVTGVLAKTASGALDVIPIIYETNISRTLENLKEFDFWSVGLAEEGEQVIGEIDRTRKLVLVLGAEGEGLRRLVADKCDYLVRLPTEEPIGSLNVSNAAAVALYALKA